MPDVAYAPDWPKLGAVMSEPTGAAIKITIWSVRWGNLLFVPEDCEDFSALI